MTNREGCRDNEINAEYHGEFLVSWLLEAYAHFFLFLATCWLTTTWSAPLFSSSSCEWSLEGAQLLSQLPEVTKRQFVGQVDSVGQTYERRVKMILERAAQFQTTAPKRTTENEIRAWLDGFALMSRRSDPTFWNYNLAVLSVLKNDADAHLREMATATSRAMITSFEARHEELKKERDALVKKIQDERGAERTRDQGIINNLEATMKSLTQALDDVRKSDERKLSRAPLPQSN